MSKEELVKKLTEVGINDEWINPDKYGFSMKMKILCCIMIRVSSLAERAQRKL